MLESQKRYRDILSFAAKGIMAFHLLLAAGSLSTSALANPSMVVQKTGASSALDELTDTAKAISIIDSGPHEEATAIHHANKDGLRL
ncbi:MAG: hypothetical protein CMM54_11900 [Rhodospirillaceae bacterium]|nr:hypothetical protein [Rhodospirillaceae bacterium]